MEQDIPLEKIMEGVYQIQRLNEHLEMIHLCIQQCNHLQDSMNSLVNDYKEFIDKYYYLG